MRSASSPEADDGPAFRDGPPSFELKAAPGEEAALRRSEDRIVRAQERRIMRTPLAVVLAVHRDEGWADYDWRIDLLHGEADDPSPASTTSQSPSGHRNASVATLHARWSPMRPTVPDRGEMPASPAPRAGPREPGSSHGSQGHANCCLGGLNRRVLEGCARRRSREAQQRPRAAASQAQWLSEDGGGAGAARPRDASACLGSDLESECADHTCRAHPSQGSPRGPATESRRSRS